MSITSSQDNTIVWARLYTRLGFSVLPGWPKSKSLIKDHSPKRDRLATPQELRDWFTKPLKNGYRSIVIATGTISGGLVARDFDDVGAFEKWEESYPDAATKLPIYRTERGYRVFAKVTDPPCATLKLGDGELFGNGGGFCHAPPSIHHSGFAYQWLDGNVPELDRPIPVFSCAELGFTLQSRTELTELTEAGEKPVAMTSASLESAITSAIEASRILKSGTSNEKSFELGRRLLGIKRQFDTEIDGDLLITIAVKWHELSSSNTKNSRTDSIRDVATAFKNARIPWGEDCGAVAFQLARSMPPPVWSSQFAPHERLLASLCRELQRLNRDGDFYISCRKAGELIGVSHTEANNAMLTFEAIGKIKCTERGKQGGKRSNRYRYLANDL